MLHANGFTIVCDEENCKRPQEIPGVKTEQGARELAQKLGWRKDGERDICEICTPVLEAKLQHPLEKEA